MQNKSRFIKINFEKTNQNLQFSSNDIIHIIFFSDKNTLISESLKNNKNLSKLLQSFLISNSVDNIGKPAGILLKLYNRSSCNFCCTINF